MAYAFKAVDQLLDPSQQKQDIFANNGEAAPAAGTNTTPMQQDVKTSTEGQVDQGGSTSGGSSQTKQTQPSATTDTSASDRAAFNANAGKSAQPSAISNVQSQLQDRSKALQDESNAYLQQGKAAQTYNQDTGSLEKAIQGDTQKRTDVSNLLNQKTIKPVDEFKPTTDVNVADANLLNSEAGIRNLAARGQGPQYTQGMAAFDAQSLRRSPEFSNLIKMIQGQQSDLQKQATSIPDVQRKAIEDYGNQQLTQAQQQARDYLGKQASSIDTTNAAQASMANKRLAMLRTQGNSDLETKALNQARQTLGANLLQADPRAAQFVNSAKIDPRQFEQVRGDYNANDFVDANDAQRYNAIAQLLGTGKSAVQSADRAPGSELTVDQTALQNALSKNTQDLRGQQDTKIRANIQQILDAGKQNADKGNLDRGYTASQAAEQEAQKAAQEAGYKDLSGAKVSDFVKLGDSLNDQNDLSKSQVDQLNQAYQTLGDQTRAQFKDPGNPYSFDKTGYLSALQRFQDNADAQAREQAGNDALAQEQAENPLGRGGSLGGAFSDFTKQGAKDLGNVPGAIVGDIGRRTSDEGKRTLKKLGVR